MKPVIIPKKHSEQKVAFLFLLPALLAFALFKYYPIFQGIFVSFFKINIVEFPGEFVGFDNYFRAFKDQDFYSSLLHNFYFWGVGLILAFWPPILLAMLINEIRIFKTFMKLVYFIPAVAPSIAVTVLWKYAWQPDYGFANYILGLFGLPYQLWLNEPNLVYWCMYFPGLVVAGGMNMLIYLASMQEIPEEQYEAAMMEGAGFIHRIWYITIPRILPVIKIMFVLDLIAKANEVTTPLVMTGGGPIGATQTLILYAYKIAFNSQDYSYAITLANIVFIMVFVITAIQMKLTSKKD